MSEFFSEEHFFSPAIAAADEFDSDYSEKEVWYNIKSDLTTVGFYYVFGEEAGCRIAYSKKLKRIVKYFCRC